jgi:hypothetical protein
MLVPGERLELSRPCGRWILSPLRLPFRHPGAGRNVIIQYFPPLGKANINYAYADLKIHDDAYGKC